MIILIVISTSVYYFHHKNSDKASNLIITSDLQISKNTILYAYSHLDEIEKILINEDIESCIKMSEHLKNEGKTFDADNIIWFITLKDNTKAVFKPNEDRFGEIAAYRACKFLDLKLVPPTVFRSINNKRGSLQLYIESDLDLIKDASTLSKLDPKDISDMKLFYFILGQWDINPGNQIIQFIDNKFYLACIDNAGIQNRQVAKYGDFPFVRRCYIENRNDNWNLPFPFDKAIILLNPKLEDLNQHFKDCFSQNKIEQIWERNRSGITYCFWKNSLWIQYFKHTNFSPSYTTTYYKSTIDAFKKLNQEILQKIWIEAIPILGKRGVSEIIDNILERRDQVLKAAAKEGYFNEI